jgi:hypothetical protein
MSFNENSATQEQLQGHDEMYSIPAQPLATETVSEPSVLSGATALAWWDSMKYFWKKSARGGCHLAPQDNYTADVLDRASHYMTQIENTLDPDKGDDFREFEAAAKLRKELIQTEDGADTSGVEGNAVRREVLNRLLIAIKICGASAVSAEHRVMNELSRANGDVDKMKEDPKGFYTSDCEKRERWGYKAVRLLYITKAIADGEVIPKDEASLMELISARVSRALYSDAVEKGNKLKAPAPKPVANSGTGPTREELLALTA